MTESARANFANLSADDIEWGEGTFTQENRLQTDGTLADNTTAPMVNASHIPLTAATIASLGLVAGDDIEDALALTSVPVATTSTSGKSKVDHNGGGDPIALTTTGTLAGRIPTTAQDAGLDATPDEYTMFGRTQPSSANGYLTEAYGDAWLYGTGRDGVFKTGACAAQSTVSALAEVASSGVIPAGTYNYKVTAGNASGETNVSAASSNIVLAGSTSAVDLTVPVNGDADAAWRKIYRSDNTGAGTYRLIGYIPDNTTTTFRDTKAYGGQAAPSSDTTGATWSTGVAGEFHFDGDTTLPALTLTGDLVLRVKGYVTISGAITGTGVGNGYSALRAGARMWTYGGAAINTTPAPSFGSNPRAIMMPGGGTDGLTSGGTAGVGALPGSLLVIYAYGIRVAANITCSGGNGTAAALAGQGSGGGGGGGGIVGLIAREYVNSSAVTITTNGGNGGNAYGNGGAATSYGGGAGGGGALIIIAPVVDASNITHTKNAGTAGTNNTSAGSYVMPGMGGSCSGDATIHMGNGYNIAATAGQTITVTGQPFALGIA